jgi:hypothetical protein
VSLDATLQPLQPLMQPPACFTSLTQWVQTLNSIYKSQ